MSALPAQWLITQTELAAWLDDLAARVTLLAPRLVDRVLLYRPVQSSAEIAWGFTRPLLSAKSALFPSTEPLLAIELAGQTVNLAETFFDGQQVIFGVRSCDARGLRLLDAAFLETPPLDPYYARRRQHTTLIGLACAELGPTCFCTSLGLAPDASDDMDLMLYPTADGYLIRPITPRGQALVPAAQWSAADDLSLHAPPSTLHAPPPRPDPTAWLEHFNAAYWQATAERCLSCRLCAYVCPTCRCFIIRDEPQDQPGQYLRLRCWDACPGENYRRLAGGHRPRTQKGERLRNRFFCKFYYYSEQYGLDAAVACTGCGRCIDVCPVNIDITEVLSDLAHLADDEERTAQRAKSWRLSQESESE